MSNPAIEHIVVLMFENRSYDNVLGMLYNTGNQPPFNKPPTGQKDLHGLKGDEWNPDPDNNDQPITVWGTPDDATVIPDTDPGELFSDMAQQFLGLTSPESLLLNPYPASGPLVAGPLGLMKGFVANYESRVPAASVRNIMHCYVHALMPVTAYLANQFMVCDAWFASAPTHTFCNRLFSLCAAPGGETLIGKFGFLDDPAYLPAIGLGGLTLPNVFDLLDSADPAGGGPNWKVYFHDYTIAGLLMKYVRSQMDSQSNVNVANYSEADYPPGPSRNPLKHPTTTFAQDVAAGTLPPFSLIEPRYSNNWPGMAPGLFPNSNHPGWSDLVGFVHDPSQTPIDVMGGEALLLDVYLTLRTSDLWSKTLLLVTYDEPGGTYDHVPPVALQRPGSSVASALNGFEFNWSGGRVPTIVVSPFAPAGSRLVAPAKKTFDHTSIISTVRDAFPKNMPGPINDRDGAAPSILANLSSDASNSPDAVAVPRL